jgi:PKD repeat protein
MGNEGGPLAGFKSSAQYSDIRRPGGERYMKAKLLAVFLFIGGALWAQSQWSPSVTLATKMAAPDFDIDPKTGSIHIVTVGIWNLGTGGVKYIKTDSLGNILLQEAIPGTEADEGGWTYGPSIALDTDGTPHVCYRWQVDQQANQRLYNTYYINKRSGNWAGKVQLFNAVNYGYMIRIALDGNNRVHIANGYVVTPSWKGKVNYYRISDGSITQRIENLESYLIDDRLEIDASSDGKVHLVMGCPNPSNAPISYYRSDDGGNTLNPVGDIHSTQCIGRNGSPDMFVDKSGIVHICYGSQVDQDAQGKPSIRYVRYEGGIQIRHVLATQPGALENYNVDGWGLGSVAATDDGQTVGIAYLTKGAGDLYFILSTDGGATWSNPARIAAGGVGSEDGRSKHVLRAYRNNFYLVYPQGQNVLMTVCRNVGDNPPVANAGGPYNGTEGSPIMFSGSGSRDSGGNPGIVTYAWDFENNGTWDVVSASAIAQHTYPDNFNGTVRLKVTDRAGFTSENTTSVHVINVAPTIEIGANRSGKEGDTFRFQATISDPGQETLIVIWNFEHGETAQGLVQDRVFRHEGVYKIKATVTDDDGASSKDSLLVTVLNVPPVAEAGGPYIGKKGDSIVFHGTATDPGILDILTYSWDLDSDGSYETVEQNPSKIFTAEGQFIVRLHVMDDADSVGTDSATVIITKDKPKISPIPDQTVNEARAFPPIALDNYVFDWFHNDKQLTWQISGNQALVSTLANRTLSVRPPDDDWNGAEILILVVTDPDSNADTTNVRFTVLAVNDPPVWISHVPTITMLKDSASVVSLDSLREHVRDVDDPIANITFSIRGNRFIQWSLDAVRNRIMLSPVPKWHGTEKIAFVAADRVGATGLDSVTVVVKDVFFPPAPFLLTEPMYYHADFWPDTIWFRWHSSHATDSSGTVYYSWRLKEQGGVIDPLRSAMVFDTVLAFVPDSRLSNGIFLWNVEAMDLHQLIRESDNIGILHIGPSGIDSREPFVPTAYRLFQNYPNPFNPSTRIMFSLPEAADVRLAVYNPFGQEVCVLFEGKKNAGVHTVVWDAKDASGNQVPSGVYLCRFEAMGRIKTIKLLMTK